MQVTKSSIFENHLALELVMLEFDAESFVPQSFEQFKQPLPERIKKAVHKRQAEYLAGRICATQALTALNFDNPIIHTADDRVPIWPSGTFGSITHTKGIAAAIAGIKHGTTGVGIDVEKLMKDSQETKLQTHILRNDEKAQFHELGKQVTHPLSVIFSAKESIYKALYPFVKKYFGFDKARLIAFNETVLTFKIMHDLSKQVQTGLEVNVHYQLINDLIFTQCLLEKK
ncbi:phosphopantetheinyl transferase [Pseudoalteromonas phenolica]|uniref:Enterobactin synthase component D n=1 Tax=Pseudoalteromonas phenolica TaxID=161398 RepID=A0A4Q7IJA6_9GAMM|nr:4'-phosphopantetheinyl transferase superfamily protein [Pseudoalteromonas phenolica]RZQ51489.1 phosphopantetheinyl transferase [Pseudoalteromonas phenolica]